MSTPASGFHTYRVLVIDDNPKIHDDIRKILTPTRSIPAPILDGVLGDPAPVKLPQVQFQIDSAFQGEDGVAHVQRAQADGRPYALAFIDMRMPPGIDGRETIKKLWQIENNLQVVVCTAYSDYTWEEIAKTTGPTTRVVVLRKPFECIEVLQLAHALTEKWRVELETQRHLAELQHQVAERTEELTQSHAVFQMIVEDALQVPKR